MKFVVAPDSFKGSLSSTEIAAAIERGIRKAEPDVTVVKVPVADGGEGTVEALVCATSGEIIPAEVAGPTLKKVAAFYGISGDGRTAFIEMAAASGLALLQRYEYNALQTTSYGTGQLILHALDRGCRHIIVGLGGSATNDGGAGLLQALGLGLLDGNGAELPGGGGSLKDLAAFDLSRLDPRIRETDFVLACDVENPLCGPRGASAVFGPQKGASPEDVVQLDHCLLHFADLIERDLGKQVAEIPGAGAAGGMGAGLMAFLNARIVKGIDLIIEASRLEANLADADCVITGEGMMDHQTAFGKTPLGIARLAQKHGIPVIGIAGALGEELEQLYELGFTSLFAIADRPMTLEESIAGADRLIEKLAANVARLFMAGKK